MWLKISAIVAITCIVVVQAQQPSEFMAVSASEAAGLIGGSECTSVENIGPGCAEPIELTSGHNSKSTYAQYRVEECDAQGFVYNTTGGSGGKKLTAKNCTVPPLYPPGSTCGIWDKLSNCSVGP
jgi:hypothetical protein